MTVVVYNQITGGSKNAVGGAMDATPAEYPDFFGYFWDPNVFPAEITFSRASTATYIDKNGVLQTAAIDTPRITHDPATLQCLGYLHEAQATNLAFRSQEFDSSSWEAIAANVTATANTATAPDGTATADTLAFVSNGYRYQYVATGAAISGATFTYSVWLWSPTKSVIGIRLNSVSDSADEAWLQCVLTDTPQRFQITRTFASSGTDVYIGFENRSSFGGDGVSGSVYAWGAQLEANAAATSYIPTTSAAVVRAADIAYIDVATHLAGLSLTDATFYADFQAVAYAISNRVFGFDAGGKTPLQLDTANNKIGSFDGSTPYSVTGSNYVTAARKAASSLRSGAQTIALAGASASLASNAMGSTPTLIYIGSNGASSNVANVTIRELKIWKRGFSAAETLALTQ